MDLANEYAIAAGGIFFLFLAANLLRRIVPSISAWTSKHLTYPYLLRRHRFLGPWNRAHVLLQLLYIVSNTLCLIFETSFSSSLNFRILTVAGSAQRAGTMALINMIPLFAGPHLSFLAGCLGVDLATVRRIHRSAGIMAFALATFHVLVTMAGRPTFAMSLARNLFAVIGASALGLALFLSYPLFRKPSHELFLRTHQALAVLLVYSMWLHVPSKSLFPRFFLCLAFGLFALAFLFECSAIIYRNRVFLSPSARAHITSYSGAVRVRLLLERAVKVEPGQYINICVPSVSFWAFAQSHPFVVISWADTEQAALDLFIEPRRGFTRELLHHAQSSHTGNPRCFFSGPHGRGVSMHDYESILMIASGFGIAAQLPHLKRLIHGYNAREVRARRIHLVWQIRDIEIGIAAQSLLNGALEEDKMEDGRILSISIYWETNDIPKVPFGKRSVMYSGPAPLKQIFDEEVYGQHVKTQPADVDWDTKSLVDPEEPEPSKRRGRMLVPVSCAAPMRDEMRMLVQRYVQDGVGLLELDYQPE